MNEPRHKSTPWYHHISRYQWLVLIVASLGWIFDVFEGQIFVSMDESMRSLLPGEDEGTVAFYYKLTLGLFLIGGALGGVLFGMLSDHIGRKKTLTFTILAYSVFSCFSAFSQTWWQMAGSRFLVALGVGGEWAVASALVAEVFPERARAHSQSIFHASSILGTYLAVAAGAILTNWRLGYLLGVLPALLTIWIRLSLREPERWLTARTAPGGPKASVRELFAGGLHRRTLIGVGLAAVGLATFWGAHIYGKNTLQMAYHAQWADTDSMILKRVQMAGMFLVTTGGGLGLLAFGPICQRLGRRGAFLFYHLGGFAASLLLFQVLSGVIAVGVFLPIFGFLTLGMHAGYAVYFPELFPTRLRSTGGGFCFNMGRILAAPLLFLGGWIQNDLANAAALVSLLFPLGALLLIFAPETKGQDLPA